MTELRFLGEKYKRAGTHTWLRATLGCPAAYGWGHWWRNGCRYHSCLPEYSCRSYRNRNLDISFTIMEDVFNVSQTHLSKKAASSLLRRTLCLVPALTWQFISWAREMYTLVPVDNIRESHLKRCETSFIFMYLRYISRYILKDWQISYDSSICMNA